MHKSAIIGLFLIPWSNKDMDKYINELHMGLALPINSSVKIAADGKPFSDKISDYRKTSNISRTLVGNKIVDHSDVVGASPVGAAPTTSSFLTSHLASRDLAKKAVRHYDNLLMLGFGASYIRDLTVDLSHIAIRSEAMWETWCSTVILTLDMLNCFKDYQRCIHILYHILEFNSTEDD